MVSMTELGGQGVLDEVLCWVRIRRTRKSLELEAVGYHGVAARIVVASRCN